MFLDSFECEMHLDSKISPMSRCVWGSRAMLSILPPGIPKPKGRPQTLETDDLKLPHEPDTAFESEIEHYYLSSRIGDPNLTPGCKRRRRLSRKKEGIVSAFLKKHGFVDLHSPRKSQRSHLACLWGEQEKIYPMHQAAEKGDYIVVLLSLRHGADPFQETSHGRTPLDLALAADVYGSHEDVINALTEPPQTLSVQGFLRQLK